MAQRLFDFDGSFYRGVKSDSDPGTLPVGYCWLAINMLNAGGLLTCRPGYRCIAQLPAGSLQGAALFRPGVGLEQTMPVIDGIPYVASFPFTEFHQLNGVALSPTAKQIFHCNAVQSARRTSSELTSPIEFINPRNVMLIQDGALSAPLWYDGSQAGQIRDDPFGLAAGGPMAWVGDRLWVARGPYVYASDIADPFSFRELIYLGGVGAFTFSGEVTALAVTPGLDSPQLLVFTEHDCSLVQANIRDRSQWPTTPDFSRVILSIGATGQRGVVSHFGQLKWFSHQGVMFWDSAIQTRVEARIALRDNEMTASKSVLSDDLSLVAAGSFGQYVLFSVPAEDNFNRHTWVLNDASIETLSDESGPSWAGYWIGTRPVEWVYGTIAGLDRIYHVSSDEDGVNRLWEAFRPERLDNGCPITWAMFSRGYFGLNSPAQKLPGSDCMFAYADIRLTAIAEDTDVGAFYAGSSRGAFKRILSKLVTVMRGSVISGETITATTEMFALKPQSRNLRTEDARGKEASDDTGSCDVEDDKLEDRDESFQLLIVGHGPATIKWVRAFAFPEQEDLSGDANACAPETGKRAIRFDGAGGTAQDAAGALAAAGAVPSDFFESNKTVTLESGAFSATGVGYFNSVISQAAADRVATVIATKQADALLTAQMPPVISVGKGFTE